MFSVCPHLGGVPISHNALQHFPECYGQPGGVPCQVQPGDTLVGGYPGGGYPAQEGTLPGGTQVGGTLVGGYPGRGVP